MQFLYPLLFLAPLAVSTPIVRRQLATSDTQNDLVNGSPCKALTIIFARGTVEAGNVGARVGPPLFVAVANLIGEASLAVQGVDYSADIFGFLVGGSTSGSTKMKTLVQQAIVQCPNTKIVMSGYRFVQLLRFLPLALSFVLIAAQSRSTTRAQCCQPVHCC